MYLYPPSHQNDIQTIGRQVYRKSGPQGGQGSPIQAYDEWAARVVCYIKIGSASLEPHKTAATVDLHMDRGFRIQHYGRTISKRDRLSLAGGCHKSCRLLCLSRHFRLKPKCDKRQSDRYKNSHHCRGDRPQRSERARGPTASGMLAECQELRRRPQRFYSSPNAINISKRIGIALVTQPGFKIFDFALR